MNWKLKHPLSLPASCKGASLTEYVVALSLLTLICIAGVRAVGTKTACSFMKARNAFEASAASNVIYFNNSTDREVASRCCLDSGGSPMTAIWPNGGGAITCAVVSPIGGGPDPIGGFPLF